MYQLFGLLIQTNQEITKVRQQTLAPLRSLLLVTIAAVIVLGASNSVFAQNGPAPKPDFSAMEEYWEVVEYEYDFAANIPTINVIAKPKQKSVPTWWTITWRDAKGVAIHTDTIMFNYVQV